MFKKHSIPYPSGSPAYQKEWRRLTDHATKRKARWRESRMQVFEHYGKICACCSEDRYEFLAIDHVDGGGAKHRRQIGRGWTMTRWLIANNFPSGFRTLCHNCNQAIGHYGYCPHAREKEEVA